MNLFRWSMESDLQQTEQSASPILQLQLPSMQHYLGNNSLWTKSAVVILPPGSEIANNSRTCHLILKSFWLYHINFEPSMGGRIPSLILVQSARYFRFFYMIPDILTALATDSCESSFFPSKMRRFLGFQMAQHKTTISSSDFLLLFLSISCKALSISWWSSSFTSSAKIVFFQTSRAHFSPHLWQRIKPSFSKDFEL